MTKALKFVTKYGAFLFVMLLFSALMICPSSRAAENRFKVTVHWKVENDNGDDNNKIEVYYYEPNSEGKYEEALGKEAVIEKTANKNGDHSASVNLPGKPAAIGVNVHGSTTNHCEYYVNKVDVETINPVAGSSYPKSTTLWKGTIGCSVKTFFSDSIKCKVYFKEKGPTFSNWYDPSSGREENFLGDDKVTKTDSYYSDGMGDPKIAGIAGFSINPRGQIEVPVNNKKATYNLYMNEGKPYDTFGAPWPGKSSFSLGTTNKNLNLVDENGAKCVEVNPDSNAADDYTVEVKQTNSGKTVADQFTVKTFDYNIEFKDAQGRFSQGSRVNYGESVQVPDVEWFYWQCDYSDWKNTKNGPQNRTVICPATLDGSGTEEDPYLIKSADDWETIRNMTLQWNTNGKYFKLANDISVNTIISKFWINGRGMEEPPFEGTFDGDGKTLTVDYGVLNDVNAPFSRIRNATIKNLKVAGEIRGSYAAGVSGHTEGTCLIKNCTVSVHIADDNWRSGGIVCGANDYLTIEDCVFDGVYHGYMYCGGIVFVDSYMDKPKSLILKNVLFAPEDVSARSYSDCCTFVYGGGNPTLENCYYTKTLGVPQGEQYLKGGKSPSYTQQFVTVGKIMYCVTGNKATVTGVADNAVKKITIPATIKVKGKKVSVIGIGDCALYGLKKLKTVEIGSKVSSIGKQALYNCKKVTSIVIKTKKLKTVGAKAFTGINKKAVVKLPKTKKKAYKKLLLKNGMKKSVKFK